MLIELVKNKPKIPALGTSPIPAQAAQTGFPNKSAIIPRLFRTIRIIRTFRTIRVIRLFRLFRLFRVIRAIRRRIVRLPSYYRQKAL
jgi:hypothetical protein